LAGVFGRIEENIPRSFEKQERDRLRKAKCELVILRVPKSSAGLTHFLKDR
jgi:hypothetical protein